MNISVSRMCMSSKQYILEPEYTAENLPDWFIPVTSPQEYQQTLFALSPSELQGLLLAMKISIDELRRWHAAGWLSFSDIIDEPLEQWHVNELRLVRDVVRSGLADAQVADMLEQLPRPFRFDPYMVAYNFSLGWVQVRETEQRTDYDADEIIEWIERLQEDDPESVQRIADAIGTVL